MSVMSGKLYCCKRVFSLTAILLVSLCAADLLVFGIAPHDKKDFAKTGVQIDPLKYLPAAARIKNRDKDVIFADLDGDKKQEVVIFYTLGDDPNKHWANILVLKAGDNGYVRLWEDTYNGSWGFADPSGVYDLNRSGRPQIIAYRTIGASCPGVLEIYQYQDGTIERITGAWAKNGRCQSVKIEDLNGDDISEIIVRIQNYGVNPDIYRWNGKRYIRSNRQFAQYYNAELESHVQAIYSHEAVPTSARVMWCKQAVEIYILQRRYPEAIQLCEDALKIIDDPAITEPDSVFTRAEAKATIHCLLGDTYKAAGNLKQARKHYQSCTEVHPRS